MSEVGWQALQENGDRLLFQSQESIHTVVSLYLTVAEPTAWPPLSAKKKTATGKGDRLLSQSQEVMSGGPEGGTGPVKKRGVPESRSLSSPWEGN